MVCRAQSQALLTRHVRDVVLNRQAPLVGPLPASQTLRLNLVLALRDPDGLETFLQQVYDPSSPIYHQFLSVQDFTNMFGPTQADYDAVVHFAQANGFKLVGGSRDLPPFSVPVIM
jgi:subtilase family serine protease